MPRIAYHTDIDSGLPPLLTIHGLLVDGFADLLAGAMPDLSVRDRLHALRASMLLINGMKERKFQPARDWFGETLKTVRIVDLDGGHSVNVECPDEFDQALIAFADVGAP